MRSANDLDSSCVRCEFFVPGGADDLQGAGDLALELTLKAREFVKREFAKNSFAVAEQEEYIWSLDEPIFVVNREIFSNVFDRYKLMSFVCDLRFSECNFDEYIMVYILQRLTVLYEKSLGRIFDSDGEFLLIDAAYNIPKWLTPSMSARHVYIAGGILHIIREKRSLTLEESLSIMCRWDGTNVASYEVQCDVNKKLGSLSESLCDMMHNARVVIPRSVAQVLFREPRLISHITQAFYTRDLISMRDSSRAKTFKFENLVDAVIPMNRVHYAQLMSLDLPQKIPGKPCKARNLGYKICSGLEMLYAEHKRRLKRSPRAEYDFDSDNAWREAKKRYEKFSSNPKLDSLFKAFYLETKFYEFPYEDISQVIDECLKTSLRESDLLLRRESSDDWFCVSQQDFEAMHEYEHQEDVKDMEELVDKFKDFMVKSSPHDGVDYSSNEDNIENTRDLVEEVISAPRDQSFIDNFLDSTDPPEISEEIFNEIEEEGIIKKMGIKDMEYNFIENIMESLDSSSGGPGPASSLIHSLSAKLPKPNAD